MFRLENAYMLLWPSSARLAMPTRSNLFKMFLIRRDHARYFQDFDRSVLRRRFVVKLAKLPANHRIKHIKMNLKSEFTRWMMMNAKLRWPHAPRVCVHRVFDSHSINGFLRIILVGHVSQTLHFCTPIKILTVDGPVWFWGFSCIDLMIKEAEGLGFFLVSMCPEIYHAFIRHLNQPISASRSHVHDVRIYRSASTNEHKQQHYLLL
jgi:hypothetical protein